MTGALSSDRVYLRRQGRSVHVTMSSLTALIRSEIPTPTVTVAWGDVSDKPSTFAPAAHVHSIADVTGLQGSLDAVGMSLDGKQPLATVLTNTTAAFTTAQETKLSGIATSATANSADVILLARANHTGTQSLDTTTDSATRLAMTSAERTKLAGVATAATANATDAALRDRSTHTGTQAAGTITGLAAVATTGAYGDLSGLPSLFSGAYGDLTGVPATFAPSAHSHVISDVTGLQTALDGKQDVGGGTVLSGEVTITLPSNSIAHTETVTATGVTASNVVMISLAPTDDADENDPELLDVLALAARPLTDQITITAAFGTRTSGPVKFNWSAF
jgi:hypothetical protein